MAIKKQYILGFIAIALCPLAVVLVRYHAFVVQPVTATSTSPRAKPPAPPLQPSATLSREHAARTVRAQAVELSAQRQPKPRALASDSTNVSSASSRATPAPAASNEAATKRTPEQLIARFIEDDPKKVFLPESVRYHEAVASEPVDQDWGPVAERQMSSFLSSQLRPNLEFMSVDCRTDLYELNLVGPSTGNSNQFSEAMKLMKQQPWWATLQFDQESGSVSFEDDRMIVVYFFSRQ